MVREQEGGGVSSSETVKSPGAAVERYADADAACSYAQTTQESRHKGAALPP